MSERGGENLGTPETQVRDAWHQLESPTYYLALAENMMAGSNLCTPEIAVNYTHAGKSREALDIIEKIDTPDELARIYLTALDSGNDEVTHKLYGLEDVEFESDREKFNFLCDLIARNQQPDTNHEHAKAILQKLDRVERTQFYHRLRLLSALETTGDYIGAVTIALSTHEGQRLQRALPSYERAYKLAALPIDRQGFREKLAVRRVRNNLVDHIKSTKKRLDRQYNDHEAKEIQLSVHALRALGLSGDEKALEASIDSRSFNLWGGDFMTDCLYAQPTEAAQIRPLLLKDIASRQVLPTQRLYDVIFKYDLSESMAVMIEQYERQYFKLPKAHYGYSSWGYLLMRAEVTENARIFESLSTQEVIDRYKSLKMGDRLGMAKMYHILAHRAPLRMETGPYGDQQKQLDIMARLSAVQASTVSRLDQNQLGSVESPSWHLTEIQNDASGSILMLVEEVKALKDRAIKYEALKSIVVSAKVCRLDGHSERVLREEFIRSAIETVIHDVAPGYDYQRVQQEVKALGIAIEEFDNAIRDTITEYDVDYEFILGKTPMYSFLS